ncbi:DUF1989 domain-containing protein [Bdellovibrio sp. HCB209]|uniref:DUF1989 domain-containing protein n=1 Tax=Bdellovibrio sp. HCB209 TaxID=3394354 RepID=UPI0039B3C49B
MNTISAQSGTSFVIRKNQFFKVIDPFGEQVADLFCFNAHDPSESLSSGRSIDYNDQIYLTKGHLLYSQRSNPLLEIIDDTCGRHDFLMTPCSLKMFQIVAGNNEHHPSCHENLSNAFSDFGINPDHISTTFNIFMNVTVNQDGQLKILSPKSKAGDYIVFKALTDLIVGITACSHEETNNGSLKPIQFEIYHEILT